MILASFQKLEDISVLEHCILRLRWRQTKYCPCSLLERHILFLTGIPAFPCFRRRTFCSSFYCMHDPCSRLSSWFWCKHNFLSAFGPGWSLLISLLPSSPQWDSMWQPGSNFHDLNLVNGELGLRTLAVFEEDPSVVPTLCQEAHNPPDTSSRESVTLFWPPRHICSHMHQLFLPHIGIRNNTKIFLKIQLIIGNN